MQEEILISPQEIYSAYLTVINDIKFSKREIDIISCILSGKSAKGIAHLLSIAPKTVEAHTYNVMKKLDCPSREILISLIERSDKLLLLKKYYLRLLSYSAFEQTLKDISKLNNDEEARCLIVIEKEEKKLFLLPQVKVHLELAGVKASLKVRENGESSPYLISKQRFPYCTLYALSKKRKEGEKSNYISFSKTEDYYFYVFSVLKKLFPQKNFDPLIEEFKKKLQLITYFSKVASPLRQLTAQKRLIIFHLTKCLRQGKWFLFILLVVYGGVLTYEALRPLSKDKDPLQSNSQQPTIPPETIVRSDLDLPNERVLLKRSELMNQIENKFKNQTGIQTIALVGMGGAGKTTLARHYAHRQKASVIWEMNAETHKSLQESFDLLAQALAKTEEDQKNLRELQRIKNSIEREERVVQFVKERLKNLSNWFLLYDNVERFADLQNYFPQDVATWGQGKVILTTRNSHIQNNKNINFSLSVTELDPTQKIDLFIYIMNNGNPSIFTDRQREEAKIFLKTIPSFPLDISIAAYYLKSSNVSYNHYVEQMHKHEQDFENVQENLLKEAGDYTKTRYNIIALSLQKIIETHKDFRDFLLLISLLDSQNIPKDVLNIHKDEIIADNFIHHLKKFSLITQESSLSLTPTFSIHRSTQAIALLYLSKLSNLNKNKELLLPIVTTLGAYGEKARSAEDFSKMKVLVSHYETLLKHTQLLSGIMQDLISGDLGEIYFHLGDYIKAKKILKEIFFKSNKNYINNQIKWAQGLVYFGAVQRELGEYELGRKFLEQGLEIYKKQIPKNYENIAWSLSHLGNTYRNLGKVEKAKANLEESLTIYKRYFPENYSGIGQTLTNLGIVYSINGEYEKARVFLEESLLTFKKTKPENSLGIARTLVYLGYAYKELGYYEYAKKALEQSLKIYKAHFQSDHTDVAWVSVCLGDVYRLLGYFENSKEIIEKSIEIYKKKFKENHIDTTWASIYLGYVYTDLGYYEEAKELLEKGLVIYQATFCNNHIDIASLLRNLGKVYFKLADYQTTEKLLVKALSIFQKNNHPESYMCLEMLSELYQKNSIHTINTKNKNKHKYLKNKSINYLKQALETVKTHFPKDSPHITRIESKLRDLK